MIGEKVKKVRVEIPMLPSAALNPNARVSPFVKAGETAVLRKAAWAVAYNANPEHDVIFEKAKVSVTLVYKNHQVTPDPDNAVAMLKPALDGCVDAKILADDRKENVRYLQPMVYEVDPGRAPLTIMDFEED